MVASKLELQKHKGLTFAGVSTRILSILPKPLLLMIVFLVYVCWLTSQGFISQGFVSVPTWY